MFVNHKKTAHRLRLLFGLSTTIRATELHGNLTQQQRLEALEAFTAGEADVMVCTDLAARGLDIPGVLTVVFICCTVVATDSHHRTDV